MEEEQNQPQSNQPSDAEVKPRRSEKKSKKKSVLLILIILLVLVGLGGGAWYLLSAPQPSVDSILPGGGLDTPERNVENSTPSPIPTPTPEEVDKSELRIELLNGTGIPGEAGLVQSELEELGYVNIEVGNADDQDNDETTVTFSSDLPQSFINEFIEQLEDIYSDVSSNTSSGLEDFDIRIIAGVRSSYTPAPTQAPQATATPTPESSTTTTPTPTISPTPTP